MVTTLHILVGNVTINRTETVFMLFDRYPNRTNNGPLRIVSENRNGTILGLGIVIGSPIERKKNYDQERMIGS